MGRQNADREAVLKAKQRLCEFLRDPGAADLAERIVAKGKAYILQLDE